MLNLRRSMSLLQAVFAIALIGFCSSCDKETQTPITPPISDAGLKTYRALLLTSGADERKLAYTRLSGEERYNFWQTKLSMDITSGKFNDSQIVKIKDLATALNKEYFTNPDIKAIFKASFLPQWITSSENIFSKLQINDLIFNVNFGPTTQMSVSQKSSKSTKILGHSPMCFCAVGSHWTCYMSVNNGDNWGDCTLGVACAQIISGCGAFYDDECDGSICTWTAHSY